jgi:hypothetical protein
MNTDPAQVKARSSSPAAERMRLHRKRRRDGMRYVRIPLHVSEIDTLIRLGLLQKEQREDAQALQGAVCPPTRGEGGQEAVSPLFWKDANNHAESSLRSVRD